MAALALAVGACTRCGGAHGFGTPGDPAPGPPFPVYDAGSSAPDSGATSSDAGTLTSDAGADPGDAGILATDAGAGAGDAGAGAGDAGEPADAGSVTGVGPADAGTLRPADAGIAGCPVFPADNPWNRDISGDPVDPHSAEYLLHMNALTTSLHASFGTQWGLPYLTVPGDQPPLPMDFLYAAQSDPGPYPYPRDVPIEGGPSGSDAHVIVVDRDRCLLYESWDTHYLGPGFHAGSGAKFDLLSNALRPDGWTAATASGLPMLPGLARYEEVVGRGAIAHALSFTVAQTAYAWVHPATHQSGNSLDPFAPPMGLRVRLSASYDISRTTGQARVVLIALRRFGMMLSDNGTDWSISGSLDARWNDSDLEQLKSVPASALEVVQLGTVHRAP